MTEVQYFPSIDDEFNKKVAELCEFAKIKLFCEPTKNETPVIWGLPGIDLEGKDDILNFLSQQDGSGILTLNGRLLTDIEEESEKFYSDLLERRYGIVESIHIPDGQDPF